MNAYTLYILKTNEQKNINIINNMLKYKKLKFTNK